MYIEFFCGIGGLAASLNIADQIDDAVAIDINRCALQIHHTNFKKKTLCKTIESLQPDDLDRFSSRFWWMSPPCQPLTRRGRKRDLDDPRSDGLKNMIKLISTLQPDNIGLENVPDFYQSDSYQMLTSMLTDRGYSFVDHTICPTDVGACNRRRRFYLVASRVQNLDRRKFLATESLANSTPSAFKPELQSDEETHQSLSAPEQWVHKYGSNMHIVDEKEFLEGKVITRCFTSAYGRSPVQAGSYLKTARGLRFFSPREILSQLGFPAWYRLPDLLAAELWPLVGNSLSIPAVTFMLEYLNLR